MTRKESVLKHFRQHLGSEEAVTRSKDSIDVMAWADPTDPDVVLLATVGMSDTLMQVPEGQVSISRTPRVELLMYAQRRDINEVAALLCDLTAYPSAHDSFFHWSHVVQLGKALVPGADLCALYFSFPPIESDGFATLKINDERIDFLWVVPISERERQFFESEGADALEELLEENDAPVSDLRRPSLLPAPPPP